MLRRSRPEDLAREAWILRELGSGTRALFDRAVTGRLSQLNVRLELEHTEAIKRAVESGLGIGCISRLALREAFRRGSLVEIATPYFDLRRHFYFLLHRQRQLTQGVDLFLSCVVMLDTEAIANIYKKKKNSLCFPGNGK